MGRSGDRAEASARQGHIAALAPRSLRRPKLAKMSQDGALRSSGSTFLSGPYTTLRQRFWKVRRVSVKGLTTSRPSFFSPLHVQPAFNGKWACLGWAGLALARYLDRHAFRRRPGPTSRRPAREATENNKTGAGVFAGSRELGVYAGSRSPPQDLSVRAVSYTQLAVPHGPLCSGPPGRTTVVLPQTLRAGSCTNTFIEGHRGAPTQPLGSAIYIGFLTSIFPACTCR